MNKLFTHTDLDGIGCAILSRLAFGNNIDICYCNYNDINETFSSTVVNNNENDVYYFTDISLNSETAQMANTLDNKKILLDHHMTAKELNKYSWCTVRENDGDGNLISGTKLFYEYLTYRNYIKTTNALEEFVNLVSDYDTWNWKKTNNVKCKQLNDLFYILGRDTFILNVINYLCDNSETFELSDTDKLALDLNQTQINNYIEKHINNLIYQNSGEYTVAITFADMYISELGNYICENNKTADIAMIINANAGSVSLRSIRDDIDLGKFAKKFGGGGHPKAAGFTFNKFKLINFIDNILNDIEE